MNSLRRLAYLAAVLSLMAATSGCSSAEDSGGAGDSDQTDTSSPTASTSVASGAADDGSNLPIPPGAENWPTQDLTSCADVAPATGDELLIRVPLATAQCLSSEADLLVVVAEKVDFDDGSGRRFTVPGFDGTVRAVAEEVSRQRIGIAESADKKTVYLVVSQGADPRTLEEMVRDMLVSS